MNKIYFKYVILFCLPNRMIDTREVIAVFFPTFLMGIETFILKNKN